MRSRTELVTTTFVDSEEDYTDDDDDSEEDWRPTASNKNGKKTKHSYQQQLQQQRNNSSSVGGVAGSNSNSTSAKRGRKRKSSSGMAGNNKITAKRRNHLNSDISDTDNNDVPSDDISNEDINSLDKNDKMAVSQQHLPSISNNNLSPKKQLSENNTASSVNDNNSNNTSSQPNDTIDVLIYVKDLMGEYEKNQRFCLWRKDDSNLLQKYIRVKTTPDEFLFTSSSVYSSWDDKRVTDFISMRVQSLDTANRRVKIQDVKELAKLAQQTKDCFREDRVKDRNIDVEHHRSEKEAAPSSIECNTYIDNGNRTLKKSLSEQDIPYQKTTKILQKLHEQSTIDEDRGEIKRNDDNDEQVEEESHEEEDQRDDDDDDDEDEEEDDIEDEDEDDDDDEEDD